MLLTMFLFKYTATGHVMKTLKNFSTIKRCEPNRVTINQCNIVYEIKSLQWRHNERDGVSNHTPHDCSLNRLFRRRSKKASKLRVTGLCADNSPVTGEFPAQRASNAENISIWWRHHVVRYHSLERLSLFYKRHQTILMTKWIVSDWPTELTYSTI